MKNSLSILCLCIILSCGQDKKTEDKVEPVTASNTETPPSPLNYSVLYSDWEIGKRENMNTVLSLYKAWDESSVDTMKNIFADSVILDLPGKRRITSSRDSITGALIKYRSAYSKTANQVLSVYPLLNKETNEDRKSTRLNSSHSQISYAVFCLKKKKKKKNQNKYKKQNTKITKLADKTKHHNIIQTQYQSNYQNRNQQTPPESRVRNG